HPPRRFVRKPQPVHPHRMLLLLLAAVLGVGLGALGFWGGGKILHGLRPHPATDPQAQPKEAAPNGPLDADEKEANDLFEAVKDSVVNVDTVLVKRDRSEDRSFEQRTGTGSGFIWDTDGRIVTNFHVIQDIARRPNLSLRVVMADRSAHDARVVGTAPDFDLAVLQINTPKDKLKPI